MPNATKFFGEGLPYLKTSDLKGKLIAIEGTDGVGRSTQIELLEDWLQVQGFGVVVTGWTRSNLAGRAIEMAKGGNMIDRMTLGLLYATDFADRLENQILPALRSGFVVIADRYVYNAFARDSARDPGMAWIKEVYGFAPIPDLVCYLRLDVDNLIPRVIESGGMNYWESGMDLHLTDNIFDSFKKYQKILIQSYDDMAEQYRFEVIDARRSVEEIQQDLRTRIQNVVRKTKGNLTSVPFEGGEEKAAKSNVESLNVRQIEKRLEAGLSQLQGPNGAELAVEGERLILTAPPASAAPESTGQTSELMSLGKPRGSDIVIPFSGAPLPSARSPEDSESTNSA